MSIVGMGCRHDYVGGTTGVPHISDDLLPCKSRSHRARHGHVRKAPDRVGFIGDRLTILVGGREIEDEVEGLHHGACRHGLVVAVLAAFRACEAARISCCSVPKESCHEPT